LNILEVDADLLCVTRSVPLSPQREQRSPIFIRMLTEISNSSCSFGWAFGGDLLGFVTEPFFRGDVLFTATFPPEMIPAFPAKIRPRSYYFPAGVYDEVGFCVASLCGPLRPFLSKAGSSWSLHFAAFLPDLPAEYFSAEAGFFQSLFPFFCPPPPHFRPPWKCHRVWTRSEPGLVRRWSSAARAVRFLMRGRKEPFFALPLRYHSLPSAGQRTSLCDFFPEPWQLVRPISRYFPCLLPFLFDVD